VPLVGANKNKKMEDAMSNQGGNGTANGAGAPLALTLPYADFSHAFIRARHDAYALAAANRMLADSLRTVLRRQQDLAFELAEAALGGGATPAAGAAGMFDRAAQAVREVGEAIIDAQIEALRLLQTNAEPARPAFAFPAMSAETVQAKIAPPAAQR
jgi:hypothetical protein